MNVRASAAKVIFQVIDRGVSLSSSLPRVQRGVDSRDRALLHEICFGVLRHFSFLELIVNELIHVPLKGPKHIFHHLIMVGIYQVHFMSIPDHAAINETVEAAGELKGPWMKSLINAVLRRFHRDQEKWAATASLCDLGRLRHPEWLLNLLRMAYPENWRAAVEANNQRAPMWIRVNRKHTTANKYRALLSQSGIDSSLHDEAPDALRLVIPSEVDRLPHFSEGWISIQDAASQLSVDYLSPESGELILDCCAAPGGKAAHILEREPSAKVVAVDHSRIRLEKLKENLIRLGLKATVILGDALQPEVWWAGEKFDRILLDAPCSATGVIRRHPDIKWLRKSEDIKKVAELQKAMLKSTWAQLKSGGVLVYATCSVIPRENSEQIVQFLSETPDSLLIKSDSNSPGRQILPGEKDMDGFYYAVLKKR